jgi:hypothetical protein
MSERRNKFLMRIPIVVLIVITVGFWSVYDRYDAVESLLVKPLDLSEAIVRRGDVSVTNGVFRLRVQQPKPKTVRVDFPVALSLERAALVRVWVDMRIDEVVPRNNPWERARLLLGQYDAKGKWVSVNHQVMGREGTLPWTRYDEIFEVKSETAMAHLILQQVGSSGTAYFKNIRVESVRIKRSFLWWRIVFAGVWVLMGVYYFPLCRLNRRRLKVLIVLNAVAILVGALVPGDWMKELSAQVQKRRVEWVQKKKSPVVKGATAPKKVLRKKTLEQLDRFEVLVTDTHRTGHFGLFASLCFLVYLSSALERQRPSYLFKAGLDVLLFAAVTETLQFLTIDRSAGWGDLRIDFFGMLLAFAVFMLFVWPILWRRNRAKRARVDA